MNDPSPAILLVDDDRDICLNMADIFGDLGYRVDIAHGGLAALELVRTRLYDVALLDLKMPGMDGLTLYREMKKTQAGVVTFLITAYAGDGTAEEAASAGMWQIMSKPIDLPRMFPLIDDALGRPLILVVEDDDELCTKLWGLLRQRGYRVCIAHDARQAIEQVRSSTRLALIDLDLPGPADGAEVSRRIRELNPGTRIVLIAGPTPELEAKLDACRAEGIDAVCLRPFDIPGLLGIVNRIIEG